MICVTLSAHSLASGTRNRPRPPNPGQSTVAPRNHAELRHCVPAAAETTRGAARDRTAPLATSQLRQRTVNVRAFAVDPATFAEPAYDAATA